jgi:DNA invertase Pin-like site-specific DNA recombinase
MKGILRSEETRAKLSAAKKNPSEETRAKLSASLMGNHNGRNQPNAVKIEVLDLKLNTTTTYNSINEAARALNFPQSRISMYFKRNQYQYQKKPLNGRYVFRKF